jgi:trk system potassium uptake protein
MYIIVVGGGQVGYYLAKALLSEKHEVLVIEKDRERAEFISGEMGSICIHGDGCEATVLAQAGTARADMLIAVTGDDEDNLVACQLAKHRFKVLRTIARSGNPKNEPLFKKLGIDVTVSSTNVILEYIEQELPTHPLTHLLTIRDKGIEIVEVKIPAGSVSIGKAIKDIQLPPGCALTLIIRGDQRPQIANPDMVLQAGDQIIALTPTEAEEALKIALRGQPN